MPFVGRIDKIIFRANLTNRACFKERMILPFSTFNEVWKNMNRSMFNCEISEEDEVKLNTLLTGNMPLFFLRYAFSKNEYREANARGFNLLEYEMAINDNMKSIETRFKSSKCLDNTYRWCMLYEKYKRQSDLNSASEEFMGKRGNNFGKK